MIESDKIINLFDAVLDINDVLKILKIKSRKTLMKYIDNNGFPYHQLPSGEYRFLLSEVIEWLRMFKKI